MIEVRKHLRKGKNKKSVVKRHTRKGKLKKGWTHRTHNGRREVFVDGFWKHDDYPNAPKPGWSYEKLMKERESLSRDLAEGLSGNQPLPHRKWGLLTRRIKKIDRIIKKKRKDERPN